MDPERWNRIQALFQDALDLPPEERDAYLAEACGDDSDLLHELTSLLTAATRANRDLTRPMTPKKPASGQQFDPYQLLEMLGQGGMGAVLSSPPRETGPGSTVAPYREQILAWREAGIQGTTIFEALVRNHGYAGSYSAVHRFLQSLDVSAPKATVILDFLDVNGLFSKHCPKIGDCFREMNARRNHLPVAHPYESCPFYQIAWIGGCHGWE